MRGDLPSRVLATYDAFVAGELERIPEFFAPDGCYRASGVFPGIKPEYRGHEAIREFWHAANDPWEEFEIDVCRTVVDGQCVLAEVRFRGRGAGSGVEVGPLEAGHVIRFRDGLIVEFSAYPSWAEAAAAAGIELSPS
jgi:ketosteroid isomerase-like protein